MAKKYYKDFIGEEIQVFISPYDCYFSEYAALKKELWKRIINELDYKNGLLCDFKRTTTKIENGKISVTGIVTSCEVDC